MKTFLRRLCALLATAIAPHAALAADRYIDRPDVQQFIAEMHERHGFDTDALNYIFRRASYQPAVIKAISPPLEPGVRSWQRYRSRFVEPQRIKAGLRFWDRYQNIVKAASDKYGVSEETIIGIIGVETIFGRNTGNFQTVSALTTLAFDYPRRAELFRSELESLLLLAREQHRDPLDYQGSYAGAMGLPQFLPSSVRNFAVDFDGDGQIDLLTSVPDAIASVARYLQMHGWEAGAPVARRARIAADADLAPLIANDINPVFDVDTLTSHGVSAAPPQPGDKAALIELVTPGADSEYWLGYQNFYAITRYNRSSFYAMTVFQLGEAIKDARSAGR